MPLRLACALLLATAALADGPDPEGTVVLQIQAGKSSPIKSVPGSNVICDDLTVVAPEFAEDGSGFLLRALKPGTTLCGVWLGEQKPGGLYRVRVVAERRVPEGRARDAGVAPDAGR